MVKVSRCIVCDAVFRTSIVTDAWNSWKIMENESEQWITRSRETGSGLRTVDSQFSAKRSVVPPPALYVGLSDEQQVEKGLSCREYSGKHTNIIMLWWNERGKSNVSHLDSVITFSLLRGSPLSFHPSVSLDIYVDKFTASVSHFENLCEGKSMKGRKREEMKINGPQEWMGKDVKRDRTSGWVDR